MSHVLLVDDNPEDREQTLELIRAGEDEIVGEAVATGAEALSYCAKHPVDCVILDYRLEVEDGMTVLAALKSRAPFCPVIMLTGQGDEDISAESIKRGAADYLVKLDLTEKALKDAIEKAKSGAVLEQKLAEKAEYQRQFLDVLVHDLRAPLRQIQQLGEGAIYDANQGNLSQMKGALNLQMSVVKRAGELMDMLESYALLDGSVSFSSVCLSEAASAARDNLASVIASRRADVQIDDLPTIRGHCPQLVQLFQNLIGNSLKYNKSDRPQIKVQVEDGLTTVVRDNGIGIPEEHLQTIFKPLKRLWGDAYEGRGLGLATCQKVVERHGGSIWCTSTLGEGSAFHIRFDKEFLL